jgi:hypothetical protein
VELAAARIDVRALRADERRLRAGLARKAEAVLERWLDRLRP